MRVASVIFIILSSFSIIRLNLLRSVFKWFSVALLYKSMKAGVRILNKSQVIDEKRTKPDDLVKSKLTNYEIIFRRTSVLYFNSVRIQNQGSQIV